MEYAGFITANFVILASNFIVPVYKGTCHLTDLASADFWRTGLTLCLVPDPPLRLFRDLSAVIATVGFSSGSEFLGFLPNQFL